LTLSIEQVRIINSRPPETAKAVFFIGWPTDRRGGTQRTFAPHF